VDKSEFKILVAEDDEIVRDVIVKFITDEGYPVVVAKDGLSALKLLRLEDIKLVLTDLRMPGADGMEVLRTTMQVNPRIAVILLTAYGTLDTALEAMNEGAYDYIVKPFVMQQLLLAVRNAYKMAVLARENEKLALQLKEIYGKLEAFKRSDERKKSVIYEHSVSDSKEDESIDMIDADEARILKGRLAVDDVHDSMKKYSSLVNELKNK
jgi:DNA-binding NtrC family response regulator